MDQTEHRSHKFVTVPRRKRAVVVRMGMCGLDDRSARCRLAERHGRCAISPHLRRDGGWRFAIGSTGDVLGPGLGFVVAGQRCSCRSSSGR